MEDDCNSLSIFVQQSAIKHPHGRLGMFSGKFFGKGVYLGTATVLRYMAASVVGWISIAHTERVLCGWQLMNSKNVLSGWIVLFCRWTARKGIFGSSPQSFRQRSTLIINGTLPVTNTLSRPGLINPYRWTMSSKWLSIFSLPTNFSSSPSWRLDIQGTQVGEMRFYLPMENNTTSSWIEILICDSFQM